MAEGGYILILDEFQYFNRKGYKEFCSYLQAGVDRLADKSEQVRGGLIVLGSVHTEMMALLEDRTAPLYNRVTDTLDLTHLDIGSILLILQDHAAPTPERLLFLWSLFEGVPKFYRDCYEQQVLSAERKLLLRRIFFESSSPLRSVTDNFLRSWLAALANPVSAIAFRPLGDLIEEADQRLADVEGGALEKLVGQLYEERSRRGIGDFPITHRVQKFWDRSDTEIDLVAVNKTEQAIRFGSCKRSPKKLLSDVNNFKEHVDRFLQTMPQYQGWTQQYVGIAPVLDAEQRAILAGHDIIPQDLNDLTRDLN